MTYIADSSATADTQKRKPGRPPGTCAVALAWRRDVAQRETEAAADVPEALPPVQLDRRGGHRAGAGRPPRDPAARSAWDAAQASRRAADGLPPKPKDTRGGARPNGGRRKGDTARANETALELAGRWMQEQQTMAARWRREMRAWVTRNKLALKAGQ